MSFSEKTNSSSTPTKKKPNKIGCGVVIFLFIILAILIAIISGSDDNNTDDLSASTNETTILSSETTKAIPKDMHLLMNEGLSESEAQAIINDLKSVGIKNLTSLKKGAGEGVDKLQSYAFTSEQTSGTLTIENKKTYYIASGDVKLFDADKGGKLDSVERYLLTDTEKFAFMSAAEDYVKQGLKAPATAKFPSQVFSGDWSIGRKDNVVTVTSYVDSQNSFGALIRSKFAVQIKYDSKECICLQIDGNTIFGTPVKN